MVLLGGGGGAARAGVRTRPREALRTAEALVPVSRRRSPLGFLDPPLAFFLLTTYAALFVPDVLLEPYATELLGVLAAGLVQGWVADQVGRRCCGARLGERAGGWDAAIVLNRSLGLALAGPLLDGPSRALGLERGPSFATALLVSAVLALAGLVLGGPAQPQNGPSAP